MEASHPSIVNVLRGHFRTKEANVFGFGPTIGSILRSSPLKFSLATPGKIRRTQSPARWMWRVLQSLTAPPWAYHHRQCRCFLCKPQHYCLSYLLKCWCLLLQASDPTPRHPRLEAQNPRTGSCLHFCPRPSMPSSPPLPPPVLARNPVREAALPRLLIRYMKVPPDETSYEARVFVAAGAFPVDAGTQLYRHRKYHQLRRDTSWLPTWGSDHFTPSLALPLCLSSAAKASVVAVSCSFVRIGKVSRLCAAQNLIKKILLFGVSESRNGQTSKWEAMKGMGRLKSMPSWFRAMCCLLFITTKLLYHDSQAQIKVSNRNKKQKIAGMSIVRYNIRWEIFLSIQCLSTFDIFRIFSDRCLFDIYSWIFRWVHLISAGRRRSSNDWLSIYLYFYWQIIYFVV